MNFCGFKMVETIAEIISTKFSYSMTVSKIAIANVFVFILLTLVADKIR